MKKLMGLDLNGVERDHLAHVIRILVKGDWKEYSHLYNSLEEAFAFEEEAVRETLADMVETDRETVRKEYLENLQQYLASIKKIML